MFGSESLPLYLVECPLCNGLNVDVSRILHQCAGTLAAFEIWKSDVKCPISDRVHLSWERFQWELFALIPQDGNTIAHVKYVGTVFALAATALTEQLNFKEIQKYISDAEAAVERVLLAG